MSQQRVHVLGGLACFLALLPGLIYAEEGSTPTISVAGSAEVRVVPDQVELRFGIVSRAKQLAEAADETDAKVAKVMEFLQSVEVPDRNVRTDGLSMKPIYDRGDSAKAQRPAQRQSDDPFGNPPAPQFAGAELAPAGYSVEHRLRITMNQLDRFAQVYRGLVEHGVNQIDSISFGTTKLRAHRDEARLKAIRAAKEKAEALANALGAKLAGVQTITESPSGRYGGQNPFAGDPFGGSPDEGYSIAAGEIEISATVHVVFRLTSTEFERQ